MLFSPLRGVNRRRRERRYSIMRDHRTPKHGGGERKQGQVTADGGGGGEGGRRGTPVTWTAVINIRAGSFETTNCHRRGGACYDWRPTVKWVCFDCFNIIIGSRGESRPTVGFCCGTYECVMMPFKLQLIGNEERRERAVGRRW